MPVGWDERLQGDHIIHRCSHEHYEKQAQLACSTSYIVAAAGFPRYTQREHVAFGPADVKSDVKRMPKWRSVDGCRYAEPRGLMLN